MKATVLILFIAACGTDGGAGDGKDVLPMRGTTATDPTIVSATASCYTDSEAHVTYTSLKVAGSDPAGMAHLGTCAATINGMTDSDSFGESSSCYVRVLGDCTVGAQIVAGITVSNDLGGVTTASTKVTISAN
jgi:hypothetical protein